MSVPRRPIRVFYSVLSQRFYATRAWKELRNGLVECTGEKFDVTNDIAFAVMRHKIEFNRAPAAEQEERR